jgi:hypothetical protein
MDLRGMLSGVRELKYDHRAGKSQPAQVHLEAMREQLDTFYQDMKVLVSGRNARSLPIVPWIAILNPDVTQTATRGNYTVYLYDAQISRVYLSANQGATTHLNNAGRRGLRNKAAEEAALAELKEETELLTTGVGDLLLDALNKNIDLGATKFLPAGYEAGNIGSIEYDLTRLPDNEELHSDLKRMLHLNDTIVAVKEKILAAQPGLITTAAVTANRNSATPAPAFNPKDSSHYRAQVRAHIQDKTRRHEILLTKFAAWITSCGFVAANNVHPRDLTVDGNGMHWLVEAKTIPANAEGAVREAIGQLFSYRHFYYRENGKTDPPVVALFTSPIGDAFANLLASLEIESIWWNGHQWDGVAPSAATSLRLAAQTSAETSYKTP